MSVEIGLIEFNDYGFDNIFAHFFKCKFMNCILDWLINCTFNEGVWNSNWFIGFHMKWPLVIIQIYK